MRIRSLLQCAVVVSAATMAPGCVSVSLTQVKQFGNATSAFSSASKTALGAVNQAEVDRKLYLVAADPDSGPDSKTFVPFFGSDDADQQRAKAEQLRLRLKLLDELAGYAAALEGLAAADYPQQVDAAAGDLNAALVGMGNTIRAAGGESVGISDAQLGVIATAVNAIGKGVIAKKQREALRTIIPLADEGVQAAASLIANDLAADGELANYTVAAATQLQLSMQIAYNLERVKPSSSFEVRLAQLRAIRQIADAAQAVPQTFEAISKAATALKATHSELVKAVSNDNLSSTELVAELAAFQTYVKSVEAFRVGLDTPN